MHCIDYLLRIEFLLQVDSITGAAGTADQGIKFQMKGFVVTGDPLIRSST